MPRPSRSGGGTWSTGRRRSGGVRAGTRATPSMSPGSSEAMGSGVGRAEREEGAAAGSSQEDADLRSASDRPEDSPDVRPASVGTDVRPAQEGAEVRQFWEGLGLPGLVDVHTHFMPERVLRKVWEYFDAVGPLTGLEWPITYRGEEEERTAVLRQFGVRAFTAMLYPHRPGMAEWLNDWAVEFARRTPDCLHTATLF